MCARTVHEMIHMSTLPLICDVSVNYSVNIDEVEGVNRRITDEAGGRVCNPTISPRHRGDK